MATTPPDFEFGQSVGEIELDTLSTCITELQELTTTLEPVGCRLRRAASQSVATGGSGSNISWDTEDRDPQGFISAPSTTVTIPTGWDGLYLVTFQATGAIGAGRAFAQIVPTSSVSGVPTEFRAPIDSTEDRVTVTALVPFEAGDTLVCSVLHSTGSSVNFTAWLTVRRVGALL